MATVRTPLLERMAGAPISWGICEVPGWGAQLPVERVLGEMRDVGLRATELGAAGWLPTDPDELRAVTARYGLDIVAAFVPLVLHDPERLRGSLDTTTETAALLQSVGARCFVTCVVSDDDEWSRPPLADAEWDRIGRALDEVGAIAYAHGLVQVLHPHVDSLVEQADEVERALACSSTKVCLDTGHLRVGGTDPVAFARRHADRVGLVHLKDVRLDVAARLQRHELTLMEAVQAGVFSPLGGGDLALDDVVVTLEDAGYDGWYVFEQDVALTDGEPPIGAGPIDDVRTNVEYLRALAARLRERRAR